MSFFRYLQGDFSYFNFCRMKIPNHYLRFSFQPAYFSLPKRRNGSTSCFSSGQWAEKQAQLWRDAVWTTPHAFLQICIGSSVLSMNSRLPNEVSKTKLPLKKEVGMTILSAAKVFDRNCLRKRTDRKRELKKNTAIDRFFYQLNKTLFVHLNHLLNKPRPLKKSHKNIIQIGLKIIPIHHFSARRQL